MQREPIRLDETSEALLDAAWKPMAEELHAKHDATGLTADMDGLHKQLREALILQANTFRGAANKEMQASRYERANEGVRDVLRGAHQVLSAYGKAEAITGRYLGAVIDATMRCIMQAYPDIERKELLAPRDFMLRSGDSSEHMWR